MKLIPQTGIFEIAPYTAGKSAVAGAAKVIKLSSNENALGPSPKAVEAYHAAAATLHRYPDGSAMLLKEAIHEVLGFAPENLVVGAGSDEVIGLLVNAFAGAGDEVLYSEHGFLMYKIYAQAAGATPVTAREANLTTSVDNLLAAVTPRTKIVFVANPNNPTGTYISAAELARLRANLPEHVLFVVDGAYVEYADGTGYSDGRELALSTENTVSLRTFSKAYGLPALRLGYGIMHKDIAAVLNRIRGPFNVSSPAIAAGAAAVRDQAHIHASVVHNALWRTKLVAALPFETTASQGNFILAHIGDAAGLNAHLLASGIIVREVGNYGLPEYLRITIGTAEENEALLAAVLSWKKP